MKQQIMQTMLRLTKTTNEDTTPYRIETRKSNVGDGRDETRVVGNPALHLGNLERPIGLERAMRLAEKIHVVGTH